MEDQVTSLTARGVKAIKITTDETENDKYKELISKGQYQVTTPEIILTNKNWSDVFRSESLCQRLVAFVVDEAHCVKKW